MIAQQCIGFYNTPPLWTGKQFDIQQFEFPQINMKSFQAKPIPNNIRLGHQIEYVFRQLLDHSEAYDILVYNLPIRQSKLTLGEIDFILMDIIRHKLIHIELTYKFYIIDPKISNPIHSLIGPNRRDSFFDKMEKIKHVQFPLLHTDEGARTLAADNLDSSAIEHQCCFKGQLFQPYGSRAVDLGALNTDCLAGYWVGIEDFDKSEFTKAQYYIPTKSEWIIEPNEQVTWKSHTEVLGDIILLLRKERAPMLWMKKSTGTFEKVFILWW